MIEQIADVVFDNADKAHIQHLATTSFAKHEALSEFYTGVREALDTLVESAIGLDIPAPDEDNSLVTEIEAGMIELSQMREGFCQENPTLLNQFDELTACYTKVLFKLKRLK